MDATCLPGKRGGGSLQVVGGPVHGSPRTMTTTSSQLGIAYPLQFASSFWTYPDYRNGATVLYSRLQDGLDENESVLALIQHRTSAELAYSQTLEQIPAAPCQGMEIFAGASQKDRGGYRTSQMITAQAARQVAHTMGTQDAQAHARVARQLDVLILGPFSEWSKAHAERIRNSWMMIDGSLTAVEQQAEEVAKRRATYESRCWQADEADDDHKFAPTYAPSSNESTTTDSASSSAPAAAPTSTSAPSTQGETPATKEEGEEADTNITHDTGPESRVSEAELVKLKRRETLRQQFGFKARTPSGPVSDTPASSSAKEPSSTATSRLSAYWTLTMDRMHDSSALAQVRAAVSGLSEPRHVRLRREAESAEEAYRESVRTLDALRCRAEEVLFHEYRHAQKWEADRVVALQRVLSAYQHAIAPLAPAGEEPVSLPTIHPAIYLEQLILEYRTGPFRPAPAVFKPYYHDDAHMLANTTAAGFGLDLKEAAKRAALKALDGPTMPSLPPVLHALLSALQRSYADQARWATASDGDMDEVQKHKAQRRIWLYDVPVGMVHSLRAQLIQHYSRYAGAQHVDMIAPDKLLDTVDAPILAATTKQWLLELDSSLIPLTLWDEVAAIYEAAQIRITNGAAPTSPEVTEPVCQGLTSVLTRLPKLHLACLDALVAHLYKLVKDTPTDEKDDVYLAKLGLAMGRMILWPNSTLPSIAFSDYPALFLRDIVQHYETLFPPLMLLKAKESDLKGLSPYRPGPTRRHSLVDQRIKRSALPGLGVPSQGLQRRATQLETRYASAPVSRATPTRSRPQTQTLRPLSMSTSSSFTSPLRGEATRATQTPTSPSNEVKTPDEAVRTPDAPAGTATTEEEEAPVVTSPTVLSPSLHRKRDSVSERRKLFEQHASGQAGSRPLPKPRSSWPVPINMPSSEPEMTKGESASPDTSSSSGTSLRRGTRVTSVKGPRGPRQASK